MFRERDKGGRTHTHAPHTQTHTCMRARASAPPHHLPTDSVTGVTASYYSRLVGRDGGGERGSEREREKERARGL